MIVTFDAHTPAAAYVAQIWQMYSDRVGTFTSPAVSSWELVFTRCNGRTTITARGPETRATSAACPADAEFFGITFRPGTFMPHLPLKALLDRQDATLPSVSRRSFRLHNAVWELPTVMNVDVFVEQLIRREVLIRDPLVTAALQGHTPDLSPRALQYRFVQATGLTQRMIRQIDRAHHAVACLQAGRPIADVACDLGYFDQAHLSNALKRFIGITPAQIRTSGAGG
jgi:AraC-like DNA-binding protein